jgi:hypothetical protein
MALTPPCLQLAALPGDLGKLTQLRRWAAVPDDQHSQVFRATALTAFRPHAHPVLLPVL